MKYTILPLICLISSIAFADLNINATNGTVANLNNWRLVMSLPEENPTKRLYLSPSSIKRQGANVTYQEKWEYLIPPNKLVGNYDIQPNDYQIATITINCANKTYQSYERKLYSSNGIFMTDYPNSDSKLNKPIQDGKVIETIYNSACKQYSSKYSN